eukprot:EG_transcript_8295
MTTQVVGAPVISPTKRIIPIVDPKTGTHVKPSTPIALCGGKQKDLQSIAPIPSKPSDAKLNVEKEIIQVVEYILGDNNLPYDFFYLSQSEQYGGVPKQRLGQPSSQFCVFGKPDCQAMRMTRGKLNPQFPRNFHNFRNFSTIFPHEPEWKAK